MEIQWPLVLFTLFSSMGGCLFVFVGLNEFTKKSDVSGFVPGVVAGVLAIVGGLCSVLHLEHVERIMNALSRPTSGIFVEAVLIGCLVVCVAIYLICLKRNVQAGVKVFSILGIIFGIALSFMAGHSYIMEAVSTWNTEFLPLGYLLTALPMGSALYWAMACKDEKSGKFMAACTLICGVLGLAGSLCYAVAVDAFSCEPVAMVIGSIVFAGVIPAILGAVGLKKPAQVCGWIAFASAAVGACMFRVLMWTMHATLFGFFGQNY